MLEALAFDSGITSHSNAACRNTTRATPCGQNSATSQMDWAVRIAEKVKTVHTLIWEVFGWTTSGQNSATSQINIFYVYMFCATKNSTGHTVNTLRTAILNCLNARSRGLTFRHRASCT